MIGPDDARHGSRAGSLAGCGDDCCRVPAIRYQKFSRVRRELDGLQTIDAHRVIDRVQWWQARSVTLQGLTDAAGLGYGTLAELMAGERDVCLKSTEQKILAVTWDTLPARALCAADLTRLRIYSLMAAGHPLAWISEEAVEGLPVSGRWRYQARVTLGTARNVMAVYDAAPLDGPSKGTAVKARNRGHRHPLAWDDPGVPAMPPEWDPYPTEDPTDALVVSRAVALAELLEQGANVSAACRRLHVSQAALQKWCGNHDLSETYRALAAREHQNGGRNSWHTGELVAS